MNKRMCLDDMEAKVLKLLQYNLPYFDTEYIHWHANKFARMLTRLVRDEVSNEELAEWMQHE